VHCDAGEFTVLVREEVVKAAPAILKAHGIAEDRSQDVKDQGTLPNQCKGILAGTIGQVKMTEAS
jgi:hypothetical protein